MSACWRADGLMLVVMLMGSMSLTQAQSLRDPTVAPTTSGVATAGSADAQFEGATAAGGRAILVRDGVPYLVQGTRLYAKGQLLGQARIERISETEVWLREAGQLKKISVFGGVQRRVAVPASAASAAQKSRVKPRPTLNKP